MRSSRVTGLALVLSASSALCLLPRAASAQMSAKAGQITTTLTLPEGVTKMKAVVAFTATGLGSNWGNDAEFRAMAKRLDAGVIKIGGADEFGDASYPTRCKTGQFKWLLDSLTELGKVTNHPELANIPIIAGGHSHGGDYWNYFNACYPERMALIFCKASGGVNYGKGALRTPMVWEIGTEDLRSSNGNFRGVMMAHRPKTQMTLIIGPGESHGGFTPASRQMVIDAIESIVRLRIPANADAAAGPVVLNDIDEASGKYFLGDNYSKDYTAYSDSPVKGSLEKSSFLADEEIAKKWKAYGAALPAAITVEAGGVCTKCYKPLADEPELKPPHYGDGTATPPSSDAGAAPGGDDAAPPSSQGGAGGSSGSTPATGGSSAPPPAAGGSTTGGSTTTPSTGGTSGTNSPPRATGGSSVPTTEPEGGVASACAFAPSPRNRGANGLLVLGVGLLIALAARRRRNRRAPR